MLQSGNIVDGSIGLDGGISEQAVFVWYSGYIGEQSQIKKPTAEI